jgi:pimeloyl-ACP methyl ester carboxylesterase
MTSYRPKPLLADARRSVGGQYVELSRGVTHFRLEGPEDGLPLVLLHGATVPLWEFDFLASELLKAKLRILRFDFYGHGLSDRPQTDYTLELFVTQTLELMEAVRFPRPAAILGHSVGAAVASAVAATRPDWIERLVLVAPMLNFNATTLWSLAFRCPGVGEILMRFVGMPALVRRRRARYAGSEGPQLVERFIEQASYEGFSEAMLSMLRSRTLGDQGPRYSALRALGRDVLVISGSADGVTPAKDIARIRNLLAAHSHKEIAGARHNLLTTHPVEVAADLQVFLEGRHNHARSLSPSSVGPACVAMAGFS